MLSKKNKVIIYAQDHFGGKSAKTGIGFINYSTCKTVAVVDRSLHGKTTKDIKSFLPPIPIFKSIEEAKRNFPHADVLLIGIATSGGRFPSDWLPDMKKALKLKLNIVNGLHDFLTNIKELNDLAKEKGLFIWDVRKTHNKYPIANARLLDYPIQVVLTVGTDAAIGKMTVALELTKALNKKGYKSKFIPTGQTGMMITGDGIPVDAITGDFMAGAVEEEIIKAAKEKFKFAFVEGQGSILHPGWSGVTLALLHGSLPHKLILCHKSDRKYLKDTKVKIQSLKQFITIHEEMSLPLRKAKVIAIALNTSALSKKEALNAIKKAEDETSLPTVDPVRFGIGKILKPCLV